MRAAPILRPALAVSAIVALSAAHAHAETITVIDQTQFDAAVATATQPGRNDTINVDAAAISSGPSLMLSGQATALTINFNGSGAGADNPSFNVGFGDTGSLGIAAGTTLTFDTSNSTARLNVGRTNGSVPGTGTVNMTGGTIQAGPAAAGNYFALDLGRGAGSQGTFNQSGGSFLLGGGAFQVGVVGGTGTYTMSNDAKVELGALGTIYVGEGAGGSGTLNVHGNAQFLSGTGGDTYIGHNGGTGTVNQDGPGSKVVLTGQTRIGGGRSGEPGGTGTYNLSDGMLEIHAFFHLGLDAASNGTFNQTGGTVLLDSQIRFGAGTGSYNLTGGTLLIDNANPFATGAGSYTFTLGSATIRALRDFTSVVDMDSYEIMQSTFDTNGHQITLDGRLYGLGSISLIGGGTVILNGANSYSGVTALNGVTVVIGNDTALGTNWVDIRGDSTLRFGGSYALANDMSLNAAATFDTDGNTGTLGGILSNDGSLKKIGDGTLVLNAANTYTGGTWVNAGTLQLGPSGGLASTGALQVDAGATFDLNDNTQTVGAFSGAGTVDLGIGKLTTDSSLDTTFSGVIEGVGGSFEKDGSGTFTMTGDSIYTGDTTVSGGKLVVNGSLASAVTVESGAVLGGSGSIGGLDVLGKVAPGNSIGTLTVDNDAHFAGGSVYEVEISPSSSDLIAVTGAVTIDGGNVSVLAQAGLYSPTQTYTIISSDGGRTGEFDGVTSNLAFLTPLLAYDADNVYLNLVRSGRDIASVAITPNQRAVATALDHLPSNSPLLSNILGQTEAGALQAFDALSGEVHASAAGAMVMNSFYVRDAIFSRLIQASYAGGGAGPQTVALGAGGPMTVALGDPGTRMSLGAGFDEFGTPGSGAGSGHGLTFWTRGFGAWGDLDGDGNAAGLDRSLGGFVSGVDGGLGGGWRAGVATGYMRSDLNVGARLSSADIDSFVLGGYAGGPVGDFAFRSGGAWTWNWLDTTRDVVFPGFNEMERASYNAGTGQLFAELAYPLISAAAAVEPFAGLSYVHVGTDGFTESGPVAGLSSDGADQNVGISLLGLRAGTSLPVHGVMVTPHGSVAWQYAFGDVRPAQAFAFAASGVGFGIAGVPIAQSSALIEAGIDVGIVDNLDFGIAYTGQLADQMQDNSVQGRFNWRF